MKIFHSYQRARIKVRIYIPEQNQVLELRLVATMRRLGNALEQHGNILRGRLREMASTEEEPKSSLIKSARQVQGALFWPTSSTSSVFLEVSFGHFLFRHRWFGPLRGWSEHKILLMRSTCGLYRMLIHLKSIIHTREGHYLRIERLIWHKRSVGRRASSGALICPRARRELSEMSMSCLEVPWKQTCLCRPLCLCHRSQHAHRMNYIMLCKCSLIQGIVETFARGPGFDQGIYFPVSERRLWGGSTRVQGV